MKKLYFIATLLLFTFSPLYASHKFKKPSEAELKKKLSKIQFQVTQRDGTETPFKNKYWNHKDAGIYVDIVSGEPLFSSTDKFKSGTGWPSFTRPLPGIKLKEKSDYKLFSKRTEVRSSIADSHLGHVFNDGPKPTGLRYCLNSASLFFIPVGQLKQKGYGEFLSLFGRSISKGKKMDKKNLDKKPATKKEGKAYFAGGCFWCVEKDFEKIAQGILAVTSGYMGGGSSTADYKAVSSGKTKHVEVVEVTYDSSQISYADLVEYFWVHHDATDGGGQFGDRGSQYKPIIYYGNQEEKLAATQSRDKLDSSAVFERKIQTNILRSSVFYKAEDYHQDYYKKAPLKYNTYRYLSGRDKVVNKRQKLFEKAFGPIKLKDK